MEYHMSRDLLNFNENNLIGTRNVSGKVVTSKHRDQRNCFKVLTGQRIRGARGQRIKEWKLSESGLTRSSNLFTASAKFQSELKYREACITIKSCIKKL
jgi:hypothetical protein